LRRTLPNHSAAPENIKKGRPSAGGSHMSGVWGVQQISSQLFQDRHVIPFFSVVGRGGGYQKVPALGYRTRGCAVYKEGQPKPTHYAF